MKTGLSKQIFARGEEKVAIFKERMQKIIYMSNINNYISSGLLQNQYKRNISSHNEFRKLIMNEVKQNNGKYKNFKPPKMLSFSKMKQLSKEVLKNRTDVFVNNMPEVCNKKK